VTGEWRKLCNEEFHYFYSLASIIRIIKSRRLRLAGLVVQRGEEERGLVGKPEGKKPLGRPRRRWVENTRMNLGGRMGWCGLDWSGSG
jgi:hypothetical protein